MKLNSKQLILSGLFVVMSFAGASADAAVKSFKDWKQEKISSARTTKDRAIEKVKQAKQAGLNAKSIEGLEGEVQHETWNFEIASDLSVTDYLVLYLAQNVEPQKFVEAAGQLTAAETAEVLQAYVQSMSILRANHAKTLPSTAALNSK